jgi:hypothetical protein
MPTPFVNFLSGIIANIHFFLWIHCCVCFNWKCNFLFYFCTLFYVKIKVKTQSKAPPKWVDIFLNYILICLKDHKWNILLWIIIFLGKYFSLIEKFTCSKLDRNKKCFCIFKALKPWKCTILVFFKCPFLFIKCAHSF